MKAALDQAATLRCGFLEQSRPDCFPGGRPPLVAVASGKGGVGKTFVAINLALALRDMGRKPLLIDLDWGLANVDVALGIAPRLHAGHVLRGECTLEDALVDHLGVRILPNGCGEQPLRRAGALEALMDCAAALPSPPDVIVADTHPGLAERSTEVVRSAESALILTTPDPTAITDTYALFKTLSRSGRALPPMGLVVNQARSTEQAFEVARQINSVCSRFLGVEAPLWGRLLQDGAVAQCTRAQKALLTEAPRGAVAADIRSLAKLVMRELERQALLPPKFGGCGRNVGGSPDG